VTFRSVFSSPLAQVYGRSTNGNGKLEVCVVESLETVVLKDILEPVTLYQVWPRDIKSRGVHPILDLTTVPPREPAFDPNNLESYQEKYLWDMRNHEKWIINFEDIALNEVIGTGSFGDVFSGSWKGQQVAVKLFMKQKVTEEVLLEMRTESGILRCASTYHLLCCCSRPSSELVVEG